MALLDRNGCVPSAESPRAARQCRSRSPYPVNDRISPRKLTEIRRDTVLIFPPAPREFSSIPFYLPQKLTPYRLPHAKQPYFQLTPTPRRSAPLRSERLSSLEQPTHKTSPCVAKSSIRADSWLTETAIEVFPVVRLSSVRFMTADPTSTRNIHTLMIHSGDEIAARSLTAAS